MSTAIEAARAKTKGKRMLKAALEAYGEDEFTLAQWNEKKTIAEQEGTWMWKKSHSNPNATIKDRFQSQEIQEALKTRFVDLNSAMEQEMHATLTSISNNPSSPSVQFLRDDQCRWKEKINGKYFQCSNLIHTKEGQRKNTRTTTIAPPETKYCRWHLKECIDMDHPYENKKLIEIPNEEGRCLFCYEKKSFTRKNHQKHPTKRSAMKIPGVYPVDLGKISKQIEFSPTNLRQQSKNTKNDNNKKLTAQSRCNWSKEHFEDTLIWKCNNQVLAHPTLIGSFLSTCGFHAIYCIQEYRTMKTNSTKTCDVDSMQTKRNQFGLCKNHLEAFMSTKNYEEKKKIVFYDSEFDVPNVYECKKQKEETNNVQIQKHHPLAPNYPPPTASASTSSLPLVRIIVPTTTEEITVTGGANGMLSTSTTLPVFRAVSYFAYLPEVPVSVRLVFDQTKQAIEKGWRTISSQLSTSQFEIQSQINKWIQWFITQENPLSASIRECIWQLNYHRKGPRLARRIQKKYRGNLARKRVRMIRNEARAICRLKALKIIQRVARGFLTSQAFQQEKKRFLQAIPFLQRLIRGFLVRKHFRYSKACMKIQKAFRFKRQRMLAWSLREEMEYLRKLQIESKYNLQQIERNLILFKRQKASRVLIKKMRQWKIQKTKWEQEQKQKFLFLKASIKLQRMYRNHLKYLKIKKNFIAACCIQRYIRGYLTRTMWSNDPNLLSVCCFINPKNGFEYGKVIVFKQTKQSYSVQTRQLRRYFGALNIQRIFRGHLGRLKANFKWSKMENLWNWIGLNGNEKNLEAGKEGRKKYGFLLPSGSYHSNSALHMIPKTNWIQPNRGFAYKYQLVLDLIQDQYGQRARTIQSNIHQNLLHHHHHHHHHPDPDPDPHSLPLPLPLPHDKDKKDKEKTSPTTTSDSPSIHLEGISDAMARFPIGASVFVQVNHLVGKTEEEIEKVNDTIEEKEFKQKLRNVPIVHPAEIIRHHIDEELFDVEFEPGLFASNGVPILYEEKIPSHRIQSHYRPNSRAAPVPASRIGTTGRKTRRREKLEELTRASMASFQALQDKQQEEPEKPLENVSALVKRLCETQKNRDLLKDKTLFVDFCFRNRLLLQKHWLQVVSLIKNGSDPMSNIKMPQRAAKIQALMEELKCFTHDPSANQKEMTSFSNANNTNTFSQVVRRPETSSGYITNANADGNADDRRQVKDQRRISDRLLPTTRSSTTRDDSALDTLDKQFQSIQAIHQLIYELKTLPRERRREEILQVMTRHQRSFICGHPGCGRCFTSHEAARLHQQSLHERQERMALGDPLVDQYMHRDWPSQSPWSNPQSRGASRHGSSMVGYFPCPHQGCGTEFRTRRLLKAHLNEFHSIQKQEDKMTQQLQHAQNLIKSQVLFLGSYTICSSNLHEKFGLSNKYKHQIAPCLLHPRTPLWSCVTCQSQQNRPKLPCRLYSAVCLPHLGQEEKGDSGTVLRPEDIDTYTIFSMNDPEFCPGVLANAIDYAEAKGVTINRPDRHEFDRQCLVYVKLFALCRDADGVPWLIGHGYHPPHTPCSKEQGIIEGYDSCEVFLDEERVIFAKLTCVKGAAFVRHCSKSLFYRKFFKKDTPNGARNGTVGGGGRLSSSPFHEPPYVVRYCRRTAPFPQPSSQAE